MQAFVIIALGSNQRHGRHGAPVGVVRAALAALAVAGLSVDAVSKLRATAPVGPKQRGYVNAAVRGTTALGPAALLAVLHRIEAGFGRKRRRKWGARVLDLDLIAYGSIISDQPGLRLPHPQMHLRTFVLDPVCDVCPDWRHPRLRLTARQLRARLTRPSPVRRETPAPWGLVAQSVEQRTFNL